ncbi:hypothetical protein LXA43DRAFT_1066935 [Ganoderma leucocontextum]|nr:hypothetical protein LXA43DRAFT_1066935 [Ganoderma leucocontextum]
MPPKAKAKKGEAPEASVFVQWTGVHTDRIVPPQDKGKVGKPNASASCVTGVRIPKVEEHETVPHPQESEVQKRQEEEEKAYLGRAKLDILKEPPRVKFRWGTWNKRRPVDSSVKKLVKSYQTEGKHPNRAPILLRVKLEDLVEGSYAKKTEEVVAWEDLPELKFKARADGRPITIDFFSGQHRMKAAGEWQAKMMNDCKQKEGNAAKVQNKLGGEGSERQQDDLDGLQKAINVLHVKIETAGHWCVHIYIEEKSSDVLCRYLSQNEYLPSLRATVEERLFGYMASMEANLQEYKKGHPNEEAPTPGSDKWESAVLRPVLTQVQQAAFGPSYLLTMPALWDIVNDLATFAAYRNGRILTIKLFDSVLKPPSRANNQSCAMGELWSTLVRDGIKRMRFVASPTGFPDLEDTNDETAGILSDMRKIWADDPEDPLEVPASKVALRHGEGKTWATISEGDQEVLREEYEGQVSAKYTSWQASVLSAGVRNVVWTQELLDKIDQQYCLHLRPKDVIAYLGHPGHKPLEDAMARYNKAVEGVVKDDWATRYKVYTQTDDGQGHTIPAREPEMGSDDAKDMLALFSAERRLRWTQELVDAEQAYDLPWPTESFLQDLRRVLERYGPAIQWTIRMLDPLVDANIRRPDEKAFWDYGSYAVYFLTRPTMFVTQRGLSTRFYRWLYDQIPTIAQVAILIAEFTVPSIDRFYTLSFQAWLTSIGKARKKQGTNANLPAPTIIQDHDLGLSLKSSDWAILNTTAEFIRSSMAAEKKKKGAAAAANQDDLSQFHDVGKIFNGIPMAVVRKHPGLFFMFRHATDWLGLKTRSAPDTAMAYAMLCYFGFQHCLSTTARILDYACGRRLRKSLVNFASDFCKATVAIEPNSKAPGKGKVVTRLHWANWDHDCLNFLLEEGKARNADSPRIVIKDAVIELGSVDRRQEYTRHMKRLVTSVMGMSCARNGITSRPPPGLPTDIADGLEHLLQMLHENAQLLEAEYSAPPGAVVVMPRPDDCRPIHVPKVPYAAVEHAYKTLEEFREADEKKYAVFRALRKANGGAPSDRSIRPQDYEWKKVVPKVSRRSQRMKDTEYVPSGKTAGGARKANDDDNDDDEDDEDDDDESLSGLLSEQGESEKPDDEATEEQTDDGEQANDDEHPADDDNEDADNNNDPEDGSREASQVKDDDGEKADNEDAPLADNDDAMDVDKTTALDSAAPNAPSAPEEPALLPQPSAHAVVNATTVDSTQTPANTDTPPIPGSPTPPAPTASSEIGVPAPVATPDPNVGEQVSLNDSAQGRLAESGAAVLAIPGEPKDVETVNTGKAVGEVSQPGGEMSTSTPTLGGSPLSSLASSTTSSQVMPALGADPVYEEPAGEPASTEQEEEPVIVAPKKGKAARRGGKPAAASVPRATAGPSAHTRLNTRVLDGTADASNDTGGKTSAVGQEKDAKTGRTRKRAHSATKGPATASDGGETPNVSPKVPKAKKKKTVKDGADAMSEVPEGSDIEQDNGMPAIRMG